MDSITQALLGATTFAIVKDKDIGKQSLLIGAIAGTLPDLDVFLSPWFSDVEFLSVHRSVSHSISLAILASLGLGLLFHRLYKQKQSLWSWNVAFFLSIMTHSLLDWFTTYGTKLLSPFTNHLFSTNSIHVINPFYTIILLVGTLWLIFGKSVKRQQVIKNTLLISTLYLSWTFVMKGVANKNFVDSLEHQGIAFTELLVSPTPMNALLWHGIAKTKDGYYFGTYSLYDSRDVIQFYYEESANEILEIIANQRLIKHYLHYTQDFPLIKLEPNGDTKIYAIKFGPINYFGQPEFVYPLTFNINDLIDEHIAIDYSGMPRGPVSNYKLLFQRIKGI